MQASSPLTTLSPSSPSFSSYSSNKLAEIAARVVQELSINNDHQSLDNHQEENHHSNIFSWQQDKDDEEEEEFEFAIVCREPLESSSISADDIFYNGQIRPIYPLFNTSLLKDEEQELPKPLTKKPVRLPLGKLFSEERESTTTTTSSCSSSEADDLESLPSDTYCVWTPKKPRKDRHDACKKSSSTGSNSKRWKFRDLLYRSNSDGKDTFVFLTPPSAASGAAKAKKSSERRRVNVEENSKEEEEGKGSSVHVVEQHYVKSRAVKEGDKRRSFLPYRQDLVGFFSNVNGLSRNLHPF